MTKNLYIEEKQEFFEKQQLVLVKQNQQIADKYYTLQMTGQGELCGVIIVTIIALAIELALGTIYAISLGVHLTSWKTQCAPSLTHHLRLGIIAFYVMISLLFYALVYGAIIMFKKNKRYMSKCAFWLTVGLPWVAYKIAAFVVLIQNLIIFVNLKHQVQWCNHYGSMQNYQWSGIAFPFISILVGFIQSCVACHFYIDDRDTEDPSKV